MPDDSTTTTELTNLSAQLSNPDLEVEERGRVIAQMGFLFDHRMQMVEVARFCYSQALNTLEKSDSLVPIVLTARAGILADSGKRPDARSDLATARRLFAQAGNSEGVAHVEQLQGMLDHE